MPKPNDCKARQHSDQMVCHACGLVWDMNDPDPPECLRGVNAAQKKGCRRKLAPGQWWQFCGETDMGQTEPVLCTNCGGTYKLADDEATCTPQTQPDVVVTTATATLNQCPFCNSAELLAVVTAGGTLVECQGCGATGPRRNVGWNDRSGA